MKPRSIGVQLPFLCQKILEYKELLGHRIHRIMTNLDKEKAIEKICDHSYEAKSLHFSNYHMNEYNKNFAY